MMDEAYSNTFWTADYILKDIYENPAESDKCYYIRARESSAQVNFVYYMSLKMWHRDTLTIPTSGNAINNSKEDGMVYISTRSNYLGKGAVVMYNLGTIYAPDIKLYRYSRSDVNATFAATSSTTYTPSLPSHIDIELVNNNYYIACGSSSVSNNSIGLAYQLYSASCISSDISDYDPSNWKLMSDPEIRAQFPASL
jgi:hypothetical protein